MSQTDTIPFHKNLVSPYRQDKISRPRSNATSYSWRFRAFANLDRLRPCPPSHLPLFYFRVYFKCCGTINVVRCVSRRTTSIVPRWHIVGQISVVSSSGVCTNRRPIASDPTPTYLHLFPQSVLSALATALALLFLASCVPFNTIPSIKGPDLAGQRLVFSQS